MEINRSFLEQNGVADVVKGLFDTKQSCSSRLAVVNCNQVLRTRIVKAVVNCCVPLRLWLILCIVKAVVNYVYR